MRHCAALLISLLWMSNAAFAQISDGVFRDYADYQDFVDNRVMQRDFSTLILGLGGRDEFTKEELAGKQVQMENVWPYDFDNVTIFRQEDLGGNVSQEGRMYWTGKSYAFYYAILHQRENDLVVISFTINSSIKPIMARF
ncbi:MAG: hypothetical protein WA790_09065 [Sulfitobacter sp.]